MKILSMMMSIQNLVLFCQLVLKRNQIPTSIKGRNSVANLRKTQIYNNNVDLVNDNMYTKFGLNLLFRSQDFEQKPHSEVNIGIKHGFLCINIYWAPREMLKPEPER